ncbi:hypothetical protein RRG08_002528 [Elysia crispata]|uniref:Fibrinogen C-terminal domain-containing protein n=1 Tax=Elysia crispata TaxID=231223 RepID=A0AAE1AKA9_9GAST|nr:hypothetical protein RRG08_002528 [Elysia crispata]
MYRLRLGTVSRSFDNGSNSLSYSNGGFFSIYERDCDKAPRGSYTLDSKDGCWYKWCDKSRFNDPYKDTVMNNEWYNESKWLPE